MRTDTEHPSYVFFLTSTNGKPVPVEFGPKKPIVFKGTTNGADQRLVAVPVSARKKYATEAEYEKAVAESQIEGAVGANEPLFSWILIPLRDKREKVVREYKLVKITAKDGIVLEMKDVKPDEDGKGMGALPGGPFVAGAGASLGFVLCGLWLVRRARCRPRAPRSDSLTAPA